MIPQAIRRKEACLLYTMVHPWGAVVAGILEYSYLLMSVYIYMVVICPVSLDCTIYVLGVFAIEICRLIGTCICLLLDITPRQLAENSFA